MRTSDAAAKKRQIMDATCRLLVKHGFQDIVLDDVAREAGMAKGTLFLYYKSKDDLLASAFGSLVDQLGVSLRDLSVSGKRGLSLLTETVRIILGHFERKHDFLSNYGAGRFPACGFRSQEMLMKKFKQNSGHLLAILKQCAKDGVVRPENQSYQAFALVGLCRAAMLEMIVMESKRPLGKDVRKVLGQFLRGAGA